MKLTTSNVVTGNISVSRLTIGNTAVVESLNLGDVNFTPSAVTVGNVSITPAAISTPALIVGGISYTGGVWGGIINYQEFTANGTWNNPYANAAANASLTGNEQVLVMAWGGGGGAGSNNTVSRNGGGGACVIGNYTLSQLASTVSVTVGSGGTAAKTTITAITAAGAGGNTSFGSLVAYGGGGGGTNSGGGGGGGWLGAGAAATVGGAPLPGLPSTFGGGNGSSSTGSIAGNTIFGGGGGTGVTSAETANGGISVYGGGGGASFGASVAGFSVFGGNGGLSGTSGGIPAGGGSGNTTVANTGARGEVRVWVMGTAGTTAGAPTYGLTQNTTSVFADGGSVLFTAATTNVSNNTPLYYTLNNSSTATSADFTTAVNGAVIISSSSGSFTLTSKASAASKSFWMDLRTGSTTGPIVANSSTITATLPTLTYVSQNTINSGTETSTFTFTNQPIGTASSDRLLIIGLSGSTNSTIQLTGFSSVTIDGIAADISAPFGSAAFPAAIAYKTFATGTTANIVVTFNNSQINDIDIAVWNLKGYNSPIPIGTGSDTGPNQNINLTTSNNAVGVGIVRSDATNTIWSGLTERYDIASGGYRVSAADTGTGYFTTNSTNITVTGITSVARSYVAAWK